MNRPSQKRLRFTTHVLKTLMIGLGFYSGIIMRDEDRYNSVIRMKEMILEHQHSRAAIEEEISTLNQKMESLKKRQARIEERKKRGAVQRKTNALNRNPETKGKIDGNSL